MANSVTNVVVGKPLVTGGCLVAPKGSALPTDPLTTLNPALYVPVGYLTDSGVVKTEKRNSGTLYAWGGDTIAMTKKGFDVQVKVGLAEFLNPVTQGIVYGPSNVTTLTPTASLPSKPVVTLGATAGTGGTFTAGTKYWVVTAINAAGETLASNEVSATLVANGTQVLNWSAISGSTGFKVYRGTAPGAENILVTTTAVVATYTDTGTAGTTGYPPAVDSTGRGNQMLVTATSASSPHNLWDFEIFNDGGKKVRLAFPDLVPMEIGDTTFKDDQVAALSLTLQAFPDAYGKYFYQYTDDGQHL
jgi:hypothetical protein